MGHGRNRLQNSLVCGMWIQQYISDVRSYIAYMAAFPLTSGAVALYPTSTPLVCVCHESAACSALIGKHFEGLTRNILLWLHGWIGALARWQMGMPDINIGPTSIIREKNRSLSKSFKRKFIAAI